MTIMRMLLGKESTLNIIYHLVLQVLGAEEQLYQPEWLVVANVHTPWLYAI